MGNGKRTGVAVVSMILVVAAVIEVVAAVESSNANSGEYKVAGSKHVVAVRKLGQIFCDQSENKDCDRTLEGIVKNTTTNIKDFFVGTVHSTLTEVQKTFDAIGNAFHAIGNVFH